MAHGRLLPTIGRSALLRPELAVIRRFGGEGISHRRGVRLRFRDAGKHPISDPTESQRGCLRLPYGALSTSISNTKCPRMPRLAPSSDGLEMRYTG